MIYDSEFLSYILSYSFNHNLYYQLDPFHQQDPKLFILPKVCIQSIDTIYYETYTYNHQIITNLIVQLRKLLTLLLSISVAQELWLPFFLRYLILVIDINNGVIIF